MSDTLQDAPDSLAPSTELSTRTLTVVHSPDATLVGRRIVLERGKVLFVGRDAEGGLCVKDERMSRRHFMVASVKSGVECADVGSTNGTFVNGSLTREARLEQASVVRAGDTSFVISLGDQSGRLLQRARRLATTGIPILLQGETGSGKEVLARTLHEQSGRRGAFVPVNCATFPRELFSSELFGHVKSAFSGAGQARAGLFRAADGGTLFLDEVGDLPLDLQPALLRALEERRVRPVGADHEIGVDARVVAATHIDLERAVADGRFRADLHARLAHVVLRIPPLRERLDHLLSLAASFAPELRFSPDAAEALLLWHWPRNVRELRGVMEVRAVLSADDGLVKLRSLAEQLPAAVEKVQSRASASGSTRPHAAESHPSAERRAQLLALFEAHQGNVSKIATELGKPRAQVYRWLRAAGLDAAELRNRRAP